MGIFAQQTAPVVYLNGTLLFLAGVAVLQAHWRWRLDWSALVTATGWMVAAVGLLRMAFPEARQLEGGLLADSVFLGLGLLGLSLSLVGYARGPAARPTDSSLAAGDP